MALRQREWAILIRPYHLRTIGGRSFRIDYTGVPKAGYTIDLGYIGANTATALLGVDGGGGVEEKNKGGWAVWHQSTSFEIIRQKYKEALQQTNSENIRVIELINVDTLITPLS